MKFMVLKTSKKSWKTILIPSILMSQNLCKNFLFTGIYEEKTTLINVTNYQLLTIMNETTVLKMKQMQLHGMQNAFKTAIESGKTNDYTLDQFISMLIDAEWDERHNRRVARSIKNAKFHY